MISPTELPSDPKREIALVTGGTRGIGKAISIALKNAGYTVASTYANNDKVATLFSHQESIPVFKWDVGDYDACEKNVPIVESVIGGKVSILVNNAGITSDSFLHKMTPQMWQKVITTNLTSVFNMCRVIVPGMRKQESGKIVNISSINGQKGQIGQTNYSAAKAGVIGFTKALAQEVANKGITVNCVSPGYTDTDMMSTIPGTVMEQIKKSIPIGRLAYTKEIASAVLFLLETNSAFITGSTISVNGGQYL